VVASPLVTTRGTATAEDGQIPVVILCGGRGTRLREETEYRPKPMVEVGGRPVVWHIMRIYAHYGFKRFLLCLGYKGFMIKEYFLNYRAIANDFTLQLGQHPNVTFADHDDEVDWTITMADTGVDAMTGARVKRAQKYLTAETFMLTYGDGLADIDVAALLRFHRRAGKLVTVTGIHPPSRFGEMQVDGDVVTSFTEKPQVSEGRVNGGFFVCQRAFLDYLSDDESCVLEQEPLRRAAADGQLAVYTHEGFWQCMDTFREYELLTGLWEENRAPWRVWK
jgi:glucose-1-phosphate cytidylyltransferase